MTKKRIIFMGSPAFAVPTLQKLAEAKDFDIVGVVTQPDKPVGRSKTPQPTPVKECAQTMGLPVFDPKTLKSPASLDLIRLLRPDAIVVVAYGKILPKEILEIPPKGVLNLHPSLLPKYRGPSPIPFAILNGEEKTGVTIMLLDEETDHGPILAQKEIAIEKKDTGETLLVRAGKVGAEFFAQTLQKYLAGAIIPAPQDHMQATFTKIFSREDGKIDWNESAKHIERKIRAFAPWPGTYSSIDGKRVKILEAEITEEGEEKNAGCIFQNKKGELAVRCGEDALVLRRLQLEGKSAVSGTEFLRGYKAMAGSRFSS